MPDTEAPLNLTPGRIRREVTAIVERTFPVPRGENCMPVSEMERALVDYVNDLVHAIYAEEKTRHGDYSIGPARVEWAAEAHYYDGTVKHSVAEDENHAALLADSIATHLASLNEPTRRHNGVESVAIVNREVRVFGDGTQVISPWRKVRDGRVPEFGDEEATHA
ncbi:hypothetical protein [Plantactinospora sp. WMMB782]|uniref:hypothetical protein n=1 Tax=Plantactinospora sp. WMMB782 TaxID=3404121 RepID=UPI003B92510B